MWFRLITLAAFLLMAVGGVQAQDNRVRGEANDDLMARYDLANDAATCTVESGDNLLAVARTDAGDILAYVGNRYCEGQVWLTADDSGEVDWGDPAWIESLPIVNAQPTAESLLDAETYESICDGAGSAGTGNLSAAPPHTVFARGVVIPDAYQADSLDTLDLVLCTETHPQLIERCAYRTSNGMVYVQRIRRDFTVRLVNYKTGKIIRERQFTGLNPSICPNRLISAVLVGPQVSAELWLNWAFSNVQGSEISLTYRTTVNTDRMNSRLEPSTRADIVTVLDSGDPVSLFGINAAGDWVVGLTPAMEAAWFFVDLLEIADVTRLDELPVVSGPADTIPIPLPDSE